MKIYPYLIIGGGMTAHAAVQGIREVDQSSRIGLFSIEKYQPYSRPPLTKGLWKGKPLEKIWLKHLDLKVELFLGQRITVLDAQNKQVQNEKGEIFRYDYKKLRSFTGQGKHFVIIGGSFIGSELAAALAMNGEKATLIYPDPGLGEHIFPDELALFLNEYYREKGVEVLPGTRVTTVDEQNGSLQVRTDRGAQIRADHVLAGIGILPNSELAESAGLTVEDGIVVNEYLQTSHPDIYAAGDVAAFYNPALGTRMRVEHEDNALTMGKLAGKNMVLAKTGDQPLPYHHLPYFYSDLFELG
jgi:3-phenylpropionate/trans-cinnamate dioxygenase ferredoxin reductase subunit